MTKEIIFNEKNYGKLNEELDKVQAKSRTRTISVEDMKYALESLEKKLGISKKNMNGLKIDFCYFAERYPNKYKWIPEGTCFTATYKNGSWRVVDIYRGNCDKTRRYEIYWTEAAKAAFIENKIDFLLV